MKDKIQSNELSYSPHMQFSCTKSQICNGGYFKLVARLLSRGSITELAQDYGNSNEESVAP